MIATRVGAISAARRRGYKMVNKRSVDDELQELANGSHMMIEDRDIIENTRRKLKFRKIPWAEWIVGTIFIMGGVFSQLFISYHLKPSENHKQPWLSIILLLALTIIGCTFIYVGRI
jgi:hypothetical protein